ncbi:rhodopsin, GQ-coupled-like [Xenia sp. Carnegie-2017]|uniref:rhodopsin, GQ-coupled-like n=1 Tax=Xenia sp. Carnegie-2017 TaxID=2897299 RepID=UPI001F0359D5|nr:rhodopsin, GQ-coupled-like [Xenia sp. Carnegie-2017]
MMITICIVALFVLVNFAEPSENCNTRYERKYKRKNCSCSIPVKQLPKNCIDIRKEIHKNEWERTYGKVHLAIIAVGPVGIILNTLLVLVMLRDPMKILHRGAWITILNLSLSDTMACSARVASSIIVKWWDIEVNNKSKIYTEFFWQFGVVGSFFFLTLLTVQTFMIVKYPIRSRLAMTRRRVLLIIGIVWVMSLALALPEIDDISKDKRHYFFLATISVLEFATIIQIIMKIFIIKEILSPIEMMTNDFRNEQQREVAKTVILLNAILMVTAIPYFIFKQRTFLLHFVEV